MIIPRLAGEVENEALLRGGSQPRSGKRSLTDMPSRAPGCVAILALMLSAACSSKHEPSSSQVPAPSRAASEARSSTSSDSGLPDCDIPTERLGIGVQGEATTVAIAVKVTTASGDACSAAGTQILLRLVDSHGRLLPVTGNPAVAQIGTDNNGTNIFDWSNWCGSAKTHAVILADSGGRNPTRHKAPLLPACLAAKARSELTVITG